jgi:hypothetical protein
MELPDHIRQKAMELFDLASAVSEMSDDEMAAALTEIRTRVCACGHLRAEHHLDDDDEWTSCAKAGCECQQYDGPGSPVDD